MSVFILRANSSGNEYCRLWPQPSKNSKRISGAEMVSVYSRIESIGHIQSQVPEMK